MNNTRIVQFSNARINEAMSLSELAVEMLLPSDPNSTEDVKEEVEESVAIKNDSETKGNIERVVALGKRIKRRGSEKLMALKPIQFTFESVSSKVFLWLNLSCFVYM